VSKLPQASFGDKATRQPPVLRFEGVRDDSPEALELARVFGPQIRQFYLKAAQSHAAGIVDVSQRQMQIGDSISAQYSNIQGQEIVTVKVGTGKKTTQKTITGDLWNSVLIEITAPPVAHTYSPIGGGETIHASLVAAARLRSPRSASVSPVATQGPLPLRSDDKGPVMEMASPFGNDFAAEELQQTLLVDMTSMGNIPQVQIELYARLAEMPPDFQEGAIVGTYHAATIQVTYFEGPDAGPRTPNFFDEVQQEFAISDIPELELYYPDYWPTGLLPGIPPGGVFRTVDAEDIRGFIANSNPGGPNYEATTPPGFGVLVEIPTPFGDFGTGVFDTYTYRGYNIYIPSEFWSYQRWFFLPIRGTVSVPVVLSTPTTIRAVAFKSEPPLEEFAGELPVAYVVGANNGVFSRPESFAPYGAPVVGQGPAATTIEATGENSLEGMAFIGLVTVDRTNGGVSFKAA
jgi:hypothetical protein